MLSLTLADLRYRYRQFLIAVLGAGVVLAMAMLLSGLAAGFRAEIHDTIHAVGADRWLMSAQSGGRVTAVSTFDESLVRLVAAEPGMSAANGIAFLPDEVLHSGSTLVTANVMGVGPGLLGQPGAQQGHGLSGLGEMVAGTRTHLAVGRTVLLGSTRFTVVGTIGDRSLGAGIPMVYVQLPDAQHALLGGQRVVTAVVADGVPVRVPPGLTSLTPEQVVDATLKTLAGGIDSIKNARVLMWVVAVIIVAALVYVSALQRVRDFSVQGPGLVVCDVVRDVGAGGRPRHLVRGGCRAGVVDRNDGDLRANRRRACKCVLHPADRRGRRGRRRELGGRAPGHQRRSCRRIRRVTWRR